MGLSDIQGADMRIAFLIGIFLFGFIAAAQADAPATPALDKRVALVIGNNAYKELHALGNPGADAESLAQLLGERGFDTISCDGKRPGCFDLTRDGLSAAIAQLKAKSQDAALAFVFYAGHGMEAAEGNVLVPVDAAVDCERQQVARGVLVDEVLEALAGAKQKIVVLDACRNNPLGEICPPATKAKLTFRDFKVPDAGNFLLVSSTKPGQVADDGLAGAHSPFARALLAALSGTPNVQFDQVFNRVSKTVIEETSKGNFTQIPEVLIRGGAPEDCLAGTACAADPQAAALREELAALQRDRARDQELGETAKEYLAQIEKARGKPLSEDERRVELASLKEATRSLAARNDNRGERALEKLKTGDTGEAERLFQEDLDAEQSEERAEAQRLSDRRKKAAASAKNIAALARWKDVAKAVAYYKRALDLDPDDAKTWKEYANAAIDAGHTDEAKAAFEQAARKAAGKNAASVEYWAANGRGDIAKAQGSVPEALQFYRNGLAIAERRANAEPGNTEWQARLAASYVKIAYSQEAQADLAGALGYFEWARDILDRLASAEPNNTGVQRDLAVSLRDIGDAQAEKDDLASASGNFKRAGDIVDRLSKADPNNAGLQRDLAWSYERLGNVEVVQGHLAGALRNFEQARDIWDRLVKADPNNTTWQSDLAALYSRIGVVQVTQGDLAGALGNHERQRDIMERLVKADPNNAQWLRELGVVYTDVGDVLEKQGNLSGAVKSFQADLAISARLAKADPQNAEWQSDVAVSCNRLGDTLVAQGDLAGALGYFEQMRDIMARLANAAPNNAGWQRDLAAAYSRIGSAKKTRGDLAGALENFERTRDIMERLAKANPNNPAWQNDLAACYNLLGHVMQAQGNLPGALNSFQADLAISEILAKADPDNAEWQRDLSTVYSNIGGVLVAQGSLSEAMNSYQQSLAIRDRLAKADPNNAGWQSDLAWSYLKVGDTLVTQGDLPEAMKSFQDSLAIWERLVKTDPNNRLWQSNLAAIYQRIGDALKAQGNLPEAIKSLQADLAITESLAKADPKNAGWQRDLEVGYGRIGDVLSAQGNLREALKSYQANFAIAERLAQADPANTEWQNDLASSHNKLGDVPYAQENYPEALKSYQAGFSIFESLARTDPTNAKWQKDLAYSNQRLGNAQMGSGNAPEAIAAFDRAAHIFDAELARAEDPEFRAESTISLAMLGLLKGKDGQAEMRRALDILIPLRDAKKLDAYKASLIPTLEKQMAGLPSLQAQLDVEAAFKAGDYVKAAAAQAKLAGVDEKVERAKTGKPGLQTASALLEVSWYKLFARDFKGALAASERGIAIQPDMFELATNKAHALMFLGRARAASALYLRYKGRPLKDNGKLWEQAVLDDFKEFEAHGLKHRQMAEIKALLAAK